MKEYENLVYSDDFKICYGPAKSKDPSTLTKAILHKDTEVIEEEAFKYSQIKEIIFNKNLIYIKSAAFLGSQLEEINLSGNMISIKKDAFSEIKTLKNVKINVPVIPYACFFNSKIKNLELSCREIGDSAFNNAEIENIKLENNIKTINTNAFYRCRFKENTIFLPNKIETIYTGAFSYASPKKFYLPQSLQYFNTNVWDKDVTLVVNKNFYEKNSKILEKFNTEILDIDTFIEENFSFKDINNFYKESMGKTNDTDR